MYYFERSNLNAVQFRPHLNFVYFIIFQQLIKRRISKKCWLIICGCIENNVLDLLFRLKMKVLLIDDDTSSLEVLSDVLVLNGFECDAFENPIKAIQHFKKGKYFAILTDYMMKEMNGIDFMKEIKKMDPEIPVIIYSACDQFNIDELALKNGATNFFSKPVSWIDIEKVLSKLKQLAMEKAS